MAIVSAKQLGEAASGFTTLPVGRQLGLFIGLAASIALGIFVANWSQNPDFIPLYAELDAKDTSQVIDALQKSNIPHKFNSGSGGVMVPQGSVNEVRMKLAALGLPRSANLGFELLDAPQGFGNSQFMESVRYRRSLEGELARTISSLDSVRSARVHLGLPKESSFLKRQNVASASVMVELFGGREIDNHQVLGIVNLVSASVPNLQRENVTVVDQRGRLLTQNTHSQLGEAVEQFNYTRQLEAVYAKRIQDLLIPILGSSSVRAEVTADLDFTTNEQTEEKYDPKNIAVRSETTLKEEKLSDDASAGIPGALSNLPPALASAPETNKPVAALPVPGQSPNAAVPTPKPGNSRQQATRNYEVDKIISHTKKDAGKLKKLSIAVVLDDKLTYDSAGKETRTPLTEAEITKINTLIKNAIAFNAERGDTLNIINSTFAQGPPPMPMPTQKIYEQAWFGPLVKQGLAGLLVLFIIFMVLKPILNMLASFKPAPTLLPMSDEDEQIKPKNKLLGPSNSADQLKQVKELVKEDPKKVAQVVMNWVGKEDE